MTKSIATKSTTGSLPPAVPVAITPTFSPWTHTSDDSYIYQLSLVLATAIVSSLGWRFFFVLSYPGTLALDLPTLNRKHLVLFCLTVCDHIICISRMENQERH